MNTPLGLQKKKALFLDRDGVINVRKPGAYITDIAEFEFINNIPEAIHILASIFDYIFIVTNQQGIAKGLMTLEDLDAIHSHLIQKIQKSGGRIDAIYHCPHLEGSHCVCRKPKTGMFVQANTEFPDIDISQSVMCGDTLSDLIFAKNCGLKSILISNPINTDPHILKMADEQFGSLFEFSKQFH